MSWPKGCKHSDEARVKMSLAQGRKGPCSAETRAKLREAARKGGRAGAGVPETYYQRFVRAIGQAQRFRANPMDAVEQAFYDGLVALYGEGQVLREVPFGPYIVDFYVPSVHLAHELDGGWRHNERQYDEQRDSWLLQFVGLPVSRTKRSEVEGAAA